VAAPPVTKPQVPTAPSRVQEEQEPSQAELQQTPSTQKPVPHSAAVVQAAPGVSGGVQIPERQTNPEEQSLDVRHIAGQLVLVPSQWSGAQASLAPAATGEQVPMWPV
jgi:hypothetical protein